MSKILLFCGCSVRQSLAFVTVNRLINVQISTSAPKSLPFGKEDLIISEIKANYKPRKINYAEVDMNKTISFKNATNNLEELEEIDLEEEKMRNAKYERKTISFKVNTKQFFTKYPGSEELWADVEEIGFCKRTFFEIIVQNPEILNFNRSLFKSNLSQLMNLGFGPINIRNIVKRYPHILEYKDYDIFNTFEVWRKGGLFEYFLITLFTKNPLLFSLPNEDVKYRLNRIKYLMVNKINRICAILDGNPGIMDGDWERVETNYEYFYKTMKITPKDISRSKGLSSPMSLIVLRHTFLTKCGIFKRVKLKDEDGFDIRQNPSLAAILDTTDETFAKNVAKVSLEEYLVFKKLMNYEENNESEEYTLEEK